MPPPRVSLRAEKSSSSNPGVFMRPLKRVFTPDIQVKRYLASSFTKPAMSRGLVMSTLCAPIFMLVRQLPVSAKMWYIGSGVITNSLPSARPPPTHAETCCRLATMLPCVSIAPLETPVVPPVYWRKAMSSCVSGGSTGACRAPPERTLLKGVDPGRLHGGTIFLRCFTTQLTMSALGKPCRSPIWVVTTVRTFVRPITSWSVFAKFSRITIAVAPASLSWCSSSRGV